MHCTHGSGIYLTQIQLLGYRRVVLLWTMVWQRVDKMCMPLRQIEKWLKTRVVYCGALLGDRCYKVRLIEVVKHVFRNVGQWSVLCDLWPLQWLITWLLSTTNSFMVVQYSFLCIKQSFVFTNNQMLSNTRYLPNTNSLKVCLLHCG